MDFCGQRLRVISFTGGEGSTVGVMYTVGEGWREGGKKANRPVGPEHCSAYVPYITKISRPKHEGADGERTTRKAPPSPKVRTSTAARRKAGATGVPCRLHQYYYSHASRYASRRGDRRRAAGPVGRGMRYVTLESCGAAGKSSGRQVGIILTV